MCRSLFFYCSEIFQRKYVFFNCATRSRIFRRIFSLLNGANSCLTVSYRRAILPKTWGVGLSPFEIYLNFDGEAKQEEIVDWLNGHYAFDPACLTE